MSNESCRGKAAPFPTRRAVGEELDLQIRTVAESPVVAGVLQAVQGLVAVLNAQRQILAVNDILLAQMGIADSSRLLGLRPGEAIQCVHACEEPGGCQMSRFCPTCGAAIAMAVALGTEQPDERECAITVQRNSREISLYFEVRCAPITVVGQRFLLLFLRDISLEHQRAALERAFYHDISNLVEGLLATSRVLAGAPVPDEPQDAKEVAELILEMASRLAKEVRIQKTLARGPAEIELAMRRVPLPRIAASLERIFASHPAAQEKTLSVDLPPQDAWIWSDAYLVERILTNMLLNAFEATRSGCVVRLWFETTPEHVTACVWNREEIPRDVGRRIFQCNFSTKPGEGRGLGTYSMKLFGEQYLGGEVSFTSSAAEGTVFRLRLPANRHEE